MSGILNTETLRGLKAKATPGPWAFEIDRSHFDSAAVVSSDGFVGANYYRRDADAHLVVFLLNSIPAIEALIEQNRLLKSEADENARIIGASAERELQLIERVRVLEEALVQHNDRLRSAASIAGRDGKDTNWQSFRGQCHYTLAEYHDLTNECRKASGDFIVAHPGLESTTLSKEPRT